MKYTFGWRSDQVGKLVVDVEKQFHKNWCAKY